MSGKRVITAMVSGLLLLLLLAVILLRPSLLIHPLAKQPFIPLGNVLFALAFIAFSIFMDAASSGFTLKFPTAARGIQKGFRLAVILAVLWWPLSYLLAGNFANNFRGQEAFIGSDRAARWFWALSYTVVFLPLGLWLGRMLLVLWGRFIR